MNIAEFFRRKGKAPSPPATVTVEDIEKMTPDQLTQLMITELPKYTAIFATFGAPSAWPPFKGFTLEQQRQITQLYDAWNTGTFNMVPGVTPPTDSPQPTLTA